MFNSSGVMPAAAVPAGSPLQAAGRKSNDDRVKANQEEVKYLQNVLSSLQIDREKVSTKK